MIPSSETVTETMAKVFKDYISSLEQPVSTELSEIALKAFVVVSNMFIQSIRVNPQGWHDIASNGPLLGVMETVFPAILDEFVIMLRA